MIVAELEMSTSHCTATMLARLVVPNRIETPLVRYNAAKEGVKTSVLDLVGEVSVNIVQRGKVNSLPLRNIEFLTQSDISMDALT